MAIYNTKEEACRAWVEGFNAFPVSVAEKLFGYSDSTDFLEVTACTEAEYEYDTIFPMWSTMWTMDEVCDKHWCESEEGIKALSECGFRVYESEDYGIVFGIDGAGYDFYEYHWLPLYDARGLQWHI